MYINHFNWPKKIVMRVLMILLMLYSINAMHAQAGSMKENRSSSTYWQKFVIDPEKDNAAAIAHRVFLRLLQTWDDTRVPPFLYVVDRGKGPLAAALYDGAIIINRAAIEACLTSGGEAGEDYLAFVLAHEIIHHRSDDLWEQKRIDMSDLASTKKTLLPIVNPMDESEVLSKQRRADAEGLTLMSIVGYDPSVVVANTNFFTLWVEQHWLESCDSNTGSTAFIELCAKANKRRLHSRQHLEYLASQTVLFELGIQAYVASNYTKARHYFKAVGRSMPSHSVHSNIGLSLLGEARLLIQQLRNADSDRDPIFVFPLLLSTAPLRGSQLEIGATMRSKHNVQKIAELKYELKVTLGKAINAFTSASEIDPENRATLIHLSSAYLMSGNTPMAKGKLQGEYVPKFGTDGAVRILLAIAAALEGELKEARSALSQLLEPRPDAFVAGPFDPDQLIYAATYSLAALLRKTGEHTAADEQWRALALRAKENGQSELFQQSLAELVSRSIPKVSSLETPAVKVSLGDVVPKQIDHIKHSQLVSFDGKWLTWIRTANNVRMVLDENRQVIATWKENHSLQPIASDGFSGALGSRLYTKYGVPDRRIATERGTYVAYDHIGVAFHLRNSRVSGWFYY